MALVNISRRALLRGLGGGLAVGFVLPGCAPVLQPADMTLDLGSTPAEGTPTDINAWIRIAPNNVVYLRMGAAEMGQGVYTSLPMLLAEELDVAWSDVRAESAPAHEDYARENATLPGSSQLTGGSESVRGYWTLLREAGATAKAMLVAAAAERWGVTPADCVTAEGHVLYGDKKLSYGELAEEAAGMKPPGGVSLKDPADFVLIGTSPPRLDLPPKVDGTATFGIDVDSDDTLAAAVMRCPHNGGSLADYDASEARSMPGVVQVLDVDDTVVVVADTWWRARKALLKVKVSWDKGPWASLDTEALRQLHLDALDGQGARLRNVARHGKLGPASLEATYEVPYLEHAPMEPLNATAHVQADRVDIWAGTQNQQMSRNQAAKIVGLKPEQVFVHTTFLGGGFGRRSETDFTNLAVKVAQHFDRPVKVIYSREEAFARGFYRPMAFCRMTADLEGGTFKGWSFTMAGQNILSRFVPGALTRLDFGSIVVHEGISHTPYAAPAHRVDYAQLDLPIPVGWWRSVHGQPNALFRECFLDEVAHALGRDPIELRRELLVDSPRDLGVLELALEKAGPTPAGQTRGVAVFESFGSYCAHVADVSVSDGELTVHKLTAAVDCGLHVHPDTIRSQVMGAAVMGLSSALGEEVGFAEAAAVPRNFHQYPVLGMAGAPPVEVHIVQSAEPPGGIGEPGLPPAAAAVCNAVFNATGKRIRALPIGDQLKA